MNTQTREKRVQGEMEMVLPQSFGPVHNMERLVPREWWRSLFNSYYLKTDSDVVSDEELTLSEVNLILEQVDIRKGDRILDLCCGQGRHSFAFYQYGYTDIQGLDRSAYLIQTARKHTRKLDLPIRFREGDARKLPWQSESLEVVLLLGNSFGYFEEAQDDGRVLEEVNRVLIDGGVLVLDITDGEYMRTNFEARSWEWMDQYHFVCRERQLSEDGQRLISREVICDTRKGVLKDQFYAERLYNRKSISSRLEEYGFQIERMEEFRPQSKRNQDLGMMAQRLLITARVKNVEPDREAALEPCRVRVILGDPRLTDRIKPSQVFDEDDFHTIQQLKSNLEVLSGFTFSFLDYHETLISDLMQFRDQTDLVFNLCDEGFENNPFMELHVPAVLEMLHIPYTGGNPRCLAACYDKSLVRGAALEMGIRVPEGVFLEPDGRVPDGVPFPGILKPNYGDSSFGIDQKSLLYSLKDLQEAIGRVQIEYAYKGSFVVEEFLTGVELTVGILGNPPSTHMVLPVVQEDYSILPAGLPPVCGYEAKWNPDSPYWFLRSVPADLPDAVHQKLVEDCVRLFVRLECRDYCRFDWRLDSKGVPHLLEVNPNPGWCWDGHLAKMASQAGMSYREMLQVILEAARGRLQ